MSLKSARAALPDGELSSWSDDGWSLPPSSYIDPELFAREQSQIFAKSWMPVVRADALAEPGAFFTTTITGEPIALLRRGDGEIAALSNVCRHRGMAMLEGSGKTSAIVCPYHKWTYQLDGRLRGAPFMKGVDAFDPSSCSLPGYRVEEWMGWVFVNLDPSAPSLAPMLEELRPKLPSGLESWVVACRVTFTSPFNWKLIVENGSESYHNIGSHQTSLQPTFPGGASRPIDTNGHYIEIRHSEDSVQGTFTAYTVFPTMTFTVQEPFSSLLWYDLRVNGVADCEMVLHLLMPAENAGDPALAAQMESAITAIHQEDIVACAKVQRGVAAPSAVSGPLSPLEAPLGVFHRWLRARLATPSG